MPGGGDSGGGIPEVIVDHGTGLLVPVDDVQALATNLAELRHNAALRQRLGEAGRARVRREYHERIVMGKLETLYRELASEAGAGSALLT